MSLPWPAPPPGIYHKFAISSVIAADQGDAPPAPDGRAYRRAICLGPAAGRAQSPKDHLLGTDDSPMRTGRLTLKATKCDISHSLIEKLTAGPCRVLWAARGARWLGHGAVKIGRDERRHAPMDAGEWVGVGAARRRFAELLTAWRDSLSVPTTLGCYVLGGRHRLIILLYFIVVV